MKKVEVLAPCGNMDSLRAAINAGADAVYLGLSKFNARIKADNFTEENLRDAVCYAHKFGVKVYLTVNILISTGEVPEFINLVKNALFAGVDAFIIQDYGMAILLKQVFPDIVLHASTQMGIHNLDGAKYLEKLGFTRVVLSRETKLEDIIAIKNNTALEIEYFVHGALCVAFSGNCYLSSLTNGCSGNRGECKQLCRLKYSANGQNGHFLSPNDLCLIDKLDELRSAGVTSFKIEGRLKRPSYVYSTVKAYKDALTGNSNIVEDKENLRKIFSRGKFNEEAYLYDNDNIIDAKNKSHTGELIGSIISVEPFKNLYKIKIKSSVKINSGDGLKTVGKTETSLGVGNVESNNGFYTVYSKNASIHTGDKVYRLVDSERENSLLSLNKRLDLQVDFTASIGGYPTLSLTYKDVTVCAVSDNACQMAINQPTTEIDIQNQMKFNDTCYKMVDFHATVDRVFMPKSQINALRRQAVQLLDDALLEKNKSVFLVKNPDFTPDFVTNIPTVNNANLNKIDKLYFVNEDCDLSLTSDGYVAYSPTVYSVEKVGAFISKFSSIFKDKKLYLNLPIIASGKDLKVIKEIIENFTKIGIVANNYYALMINRETIIGTGLNVYNDYTASAHFANGAVAVISSIERPVDNTLDYSSNPTLMTFTHCPYKVAKNSSCANCTATEPLVYIDERNNKLTIRRYKIKYCYFELTHNNPVLYSGNGKVIDLRTK